MLLRANNSEHLIGLNIRQTQKQLSEPLFKLSHPIL